MKLIWSKPKGNKTETIMVLKQHTFIDKFVGKPTERNSQTYNHAIYMISFTAISDYQLVINYNIAIL